MADGGTYATALHELSRLDTFLAADPSSYVRVVCPSQEFDNDEMAQGLGRWYSCVRGLWESLSLAAEPKLALIMLQAPPVDNEVMRYLFDILESGRNISLGGGVRHALVNIGDNRDCHLSEKVLQKPALLENIHSLLMKARRRGQTVQGLAGFASSDRMAKLAAVLELDLLETPPKTLRWGTKAGSRQIFRQTGIRHPTGSYAPERTTERLAEVILLLARRRGPGQWLVKLNDGFGSGHGHAVVDVATSHLNDIDLLLRSNLRPVCPDISRDSFLAQISMRGAVVEEFLKPVLNGEMSNPSAVGYLAKRAGSDADVQILGTHDQLIGRYHDFIGCSFPARSSYREELLWNTQRILEQLARVGVSGHVGIDFVARSGPNGLGPWTLDATEINLRQTGSTTPNRTARAIVEGTWLADGSLVDGVGKEVVYTGTDGLISPHYRGIPARRLVAALRREPALSYDPARARGAVPHLWTTLEPFGKIGATFIGRSPTDCAEVQREFISLLDQLAGYPATSGGA
jgi:hypothetical protein